MLAIVRLALRRPYTFIVAAILIVLFGGLAAIRTPTDIFPDIRIPVIAAVWTYRGLSPDDMAGRVVYYYERQLSTAVNDIDHIESQSLSGVGIVKIFFHPGVDIRTAEFGWPIGMPTCKSLGGGLYEVRTTLKDRIARTIFAVEDGDMVLLHGFIKKSQRTPKEHLDLARKRLGSYRRQK